jgi:hypothetical protein
MVKAELAGFARAVSMLFGKRTFLGVAAKDEDGQALSDIRMTPGQKLEVQSAWRPMRTVQHLAAQDRSAEAAKQAATIRRRCDSTGKEGTIEFDGDTGDGAGITLFLEICIAGAIDGIRGNLTPSECLGLWRIEPLHRSAAVGDVIFVRPPVNQAMGEACEREYLRPGLCPGGFAERACPPPSEGLKLNLRSAGGRSSGAHR